MQATTIGGPGGSALGSATVSSTCTCPSSRLLDANQRWSRSQVASASSGSARRSPRVRSAAAIVAALLAGGLLLEQEPEPAPRGERQQVGQVSDARERRAAEHLLRDAAGIARQVELDGLGGPRHVVHAEDDVVLEAPHVGEDPRVVGRERLVAAQTEDRVLLAQGDEALEPAKKRGRRAQLGLHVDR